MWAVAIAQLGGFRDCSELWLMGTKKKKFDGGCVGGGGGGEEIYTHRCGRGWDWSN